MATKTSFGISKITNETPRWAKWTFGITLLLCSVATFVIAGDPAILDATKVRINVYLSGATMLVYGLMKMFGVESTDDENGNQG